MFIDYQNNKGIIKTNNKFVKETKAALTLIEKINKEKVIVKTIITSGILKKVRR